MTINHEIQSKDFEIMHLILRAYFRVNTSGCIFSHSFHFSQNLLLKVIFPISECVQIILKLCIWDLIERLVLAILRMLLLDGIICEVYLRLKVMNIIEISWCPDVPFLIPICLCHSIQICYEHVVPNVEFSIIVKEWSVHIHLHNKSFILEFPYYLLTLSVWLFAGFFILGWIFYNAIELVYFIYYCNTTSLIGILPWLNNPNISCFPCPAEIGLLLFDFISSFLINFSKFLILNISKSFSYMKGQWYIIEHIFSS